MCPYDLLDFGKVMILDVAAVFAKMNSDAVGPRLLHHDRGFDGSWIRGAARLAQRCDMVNVDAEV